jgi:flagellar hook protein FlgE
MFGAIYTGLSGMNAYSQALQTISNNVANLNTPGYKSNLVTFNDMFSRGGSFLGSNAGASGYGVSLGSSYMDFSQGQLQQTGNPLDLAIDGNGLLTLINGDNTYYARTGSFSVDKDGYISDAQGNHLAVLDDSNAAVALNISQWETNPPVATTKVAFDGNLSSSGTDATVSSIKVFDSKGGEHDWTVNFTKSTTDLNTWDVTVTDSDGSTVGTGSVKFQADGSVDPTASSITVTEDVTGAGALNVSLDFSSGVTSYSAGTTSTLQTSSVDGNGEGALTAAGVNADGQVELAYSNGKTKTVGSIALADFQDPQQLQRVGNGLYQDSTGGSVRHLTSGAAGMGTVQSGQLESSNVNLSDEFGQLILIERGFQACSQVVSISNEMIQTMFGIRGQ